MGGDDEMFYNKSVATNIEELTNNSDTVVFPQETPDGEKLVKPEPKILNCPHCDYWALTQLSLSVHMGKKH